MVKLLLVVTVNAPLPKRIPGICEQRCDKHQLSDVFKTLKNCFSLYMQYYTIYKGL